VSPSAETAFSPPVCLRRIVGIRTSTAIKASWNGMRVERRSAGAAAQAAEDGRGRHRP
jgi:hypothetical protein